MVRVVVVLRFTVSDVAFSGSSHEVVKRHRVSDSLSSGPAIHIRTIVEAAAVRGEARDLLLSEALIGLLAVLGLVWATGILPLGDRKVRWA